MHPRPTRRRRGRTIAVLVAGMYVSLEAQAEASELPVELDWRVPAGCPSRDRVLARMEELVDSSRGHAVRVDARATIAKHGTAFSLLITIRAADVEHTRTAESQKCSTLAEAAAIALAAALDPSAASESPSASPPPPPVIGPSTEPPLQTVEVQSPMLPQRRRRASPPPTSPSWGWGIGVGAVFDSGTMPRASSGIEGMIDVGRGRVRAGLLGSLWIPREVVFSEGSQGRVRYETYALGAFGCLVPLGERVRFGACVDLGIMHMKVQGLGIRDPGAARLLFPAAAIGALTEVVVSRSVILFGRLDAVIAVDPPRVALTTSPDYVVLHDVAVPAFRLTMGVRASVM